MILEIYYNDLTPEAKQRYLDFFRLDNAESGNLDTDIIPIFQLDSGDIDWCDELNAVHRDT
tara:strand:+ start:514 stop:696 length:183 start_codon:yes stop_codon:yes gene_type:complete